MHLLEVLVHVLHLSLLLGNFLLELYHFVVGLGQSGFIQLQVIVRHLSLLLDVFVLELLEIRAYLPEVVHYGQYLRLCGIKFVLEPADSFCGLLLGLYLGIGVKLLGGVLTIFDSNQGRLVDLSNGVLLRLLSGFSVVSELLKLD